ncbi:sigma-B regulation protein RsbU (phosphoserine phosphatase) [Aneurinibacillus soli]|uniref:Phosphoserine phosphatase RsbP n=1 Tax=Aneurinibacillus soli TaxID=1500254 RepID=A0A0U5B1I0_9BACL|nr:fused response regulator/phosphatase [Aneurinibacillus soli]PYE60631.1 sigma-B regulation protein RsbU (phosphoserine phosphatase) [Aneurinibacillus soli]BAU29845.1 Phosphoserine phosphatase RsbP [Aneurinibacillus soli]
MAIVLIDTSPMLGDALRKIGYQNIVTLSSPDQLVSYIGLDASRECRDVLCKIDVIVVKSLLPESYILDVSQRILSHPDFKDVPIIVTVESVDQQTIERAQAIGVSDCISPLITKVELLARIRWALKLTQRIQEQNQDRNKLESLISCFQKELNLAKKLQRSVLSMPIYEQNFAISAYYKPSDVLSGDMYCWYEIKEGCYGVMLIDVMGHGVSASLVSMSLRALLRGLIMRVTDPVLVMEELNRQIHHIFLKEEAVLYFTAFYMVINTHNQTIQYVNAGSPCGFLRKETNVFQELDQGCCPIGIIPDMKIQKGCLTYEKGTQIVLYTDGVFDLFSNSAQEAYQKIKENILLSSSIDIQDVLACITRSYDQSIAKDDICIIAIQL